MNAYKNLMFLHGHFVHPRDADDEPAPPAEPSPTSPTAPRSTVTSMQLSWSRCTCSVASDRS